MAKHLPFRRLESDRCLCGLKVAQHRDSHNAALTCKEAAELHPRAERVHVSLKTLLQAARRWRGHQ